ncbi:PREDICTED: uncharacterized protein LOC108612469 [Drosophila arizonae]|uniref:Uncharacterized protein LOC108612469 n=1 Tax=Drosophila arizonae TaxID=7263 RepID=A0ABM1P0V4_DROAR|nr:PREDICTED: uncharacterized protein LOC108612469 [Drosophila arizonae]
MWNAKVFLNVILWLSFLQSVALGSKKYIVSSTTCKIEDADPFDAEVKKNFVRYKYNRCSALQPLTWVAYNESVRRYQLYVNWDGFKEYLKLDLDLTVPLSGPPKCCYMAVERQAELIDFGKHCQQFASGAQLPDSTIGFIVRCYAQGKRIYTNAHATVPEQREVRERLTQWADQRGGEQPALSVLLIGLDSISRQQLIRAMPMTKQQLDSSGWFELAGYNKVAGNTVPNLLALTTGYNRTSAISFCDPREELGLERCKFIWKLYKQLGYVTAFGEDETLNNTFNPNLKGFRDASVDYHLHPYLMAANQWLHVKTEDSQTCLGFRPSAEHVYEYALEFARRYLNDSFFGLFWTNMHSQGDSISRTALRDEYMLEYLSRLRNHGILNRSIVIFLSDHGLRAGPTWQTPLGWLEDRLPFLYIWLPLHLQESHPEFVKALKVNRKRLTSPYDLYATLKHILRIGSQNHLDELLGDSLDCPNCQSVFLPISSNRTCSDAGISDHWCACRSYNRYKRFLERDYLMAALMVQHVNNRYDSYASRKFAGRCQPLTLANITKAYLGRPHKADRSGISLHRIQVMMAPTLSTYEGTILFNNSSKEMQISDISRMDKVKPSCLGEQFRIVICSCR